MQEETANTNVEETQNDVSVSSTDEQGYENMSHEQLVSELYKEKEAKLNAVRHMRAQEEKLKEKEQAQVEQVNTEVEEDLDVSEVVREEARRVLKEERAAEFSKGATDWLKQQSWASAIVGETDESIEKFARYKTELDRLVGMNGVNSVEEYRGMQALAVTNVTGTPDPLNSMIEKTNIDGVISADKSAAFGYSSSTRQTQESFGNLSPQDQGLLTRLNEKRKARGEKPLRPSDIKKS